MEEQGFTPGRKVYRVSYVDYPGLLIVCKGATIGELRLAEPSKNTSHADQGSQLGFFASKIISWNMQHPPVDNKDNKPECVVCGLAEGVPLEPSAEAMQCLELIDAIALMQGWIGAITKVSPPKGESLNNGVRNPEDLMRRLAEAQNPGTLPTPNFG